MCDLHFGPSDSTIDTLMSAWVISRTCLVTRYRLFQRNEFPVGDSMEQNHPFWEPLQRCLCNTYQSPYLCQWRRRRNAGTLVGLKR